MRLFNKNKDEKPVSQHNTDEENELLCDIETAQQHAESGKRAEIEVNWDDEYKIYIGKQWDTTKGARTKTGKKRNWNSQDNFVFPMIRNMLASLTVTTPRPDISAVETGDTDTASVLNDLVPHILYRNKFTHQWKKIVLQGLQYGPIIGYVPYDQHWIGGSGPNRWVGEIRTLFMKKSEFYPDPAIIDLEERLQECSYINIKQRKKLEWFEEKWDKGKYVIEDSYDIEEGQENEGPDPHQATLITHFHKETPRFISKEWKETFLQKAEEAESEGLPYKAQDYRDMANGTLKGVHCAYKAGSIILDYIPYVYEDGLYPFVYKVMYADEEQPYGMGEERNVVIPQIMHNRVDEIEVSAMLGQGLGGGFYQKGTFSNAQFNEFLNNIAKANTWHEVNNINGIKPKQPVQVPANITNYKESKKGVIDTISQNTSILQGISPGANVPYSTIRELGARSDLRMKSRAEVLEDFLIEFFQLIINRIAQFYTEKREYRIRGDSKERAVEKQAYKALIEIANMPKGTPPEQQMQAMINLLVFIKTQKDKPNKGVFERSMLVRTWDRETVEDENGQSVTKKEEFVPELDISVKVLDERPTDPNYYTDMAMGLLGKAMGIKAFWKTMKDGKFPPVDEILEELGEMQAAQAQAAQQAQQTAAQQEMQKQALGLEKQKLQNESVEKQVAIKAATTLAKRGGKQ